MNEVDHLRKLLADTQASEKGWRKALATASGSFSRALAEKNLSRLTTARETLLAQLKATAALHPPAVDTSAQPVMVDNIAGT